MISFRRADPGDDEALAALWARCGLTRSWNDPQLDIERNRSDGVAALVVDDPAAPGRLVGSVLIGYDGHRGWVNYLAADPDARGLGIGRVLMDEAERLLVERGCPKLNLQVRAGNDQAIEFYEALGYTVDAAVSMGKLLIND